MPAETVLLTGATGFIGHRVLVELLKAGYTVRAAVRSTSKAESRIFATPSIQAIPNARSQVSFVEVPSIEADGAYDAALADGKVTYVVHVASPITNRYTGDAQKDLIDPAKKGTVGMLVSAAKAGSVKRIVITSSVVGNWFGRGPAPSTNSETRIPIPPPPYHDAFHAYNASKVAALNAGDEFMAREKPAFDVINIMPGFVRGENEIASSIEELASGTAMIGLRHLVTKDEEAPGVPINGTHINTIAQLHVLSLRPSVKGNQSFGAFNYDGPENFLGYVKEAFPKAVEKGIFKDHAFTPMEAPTNWDLSNTRETFGDELYWGDGRAQVIDSAKSYLKLLGEPLA